MFVYDPTNLAVLKINDKKSASLINGQGTFLIKPIETALLEPNFDPHNLFEQLVLNDSYSSYSRKEVIFSFEEVMEMIKNNLYLLDSSYENIHLELQSISKQIDELRTHSKILKK